jgi:hypothetical protein
VTDVGEPIVLAAVAICLAESCPPAHWNKSARQ